VRELVRKSPRFFATAALAGLVLRLLFVFLLPQVTDDSRVYADLAKNWLHHGVYGITDSGRVVATYVRLPGYPALLAAVFAIFGDDHYRTVMLLQVLIDLGTCLLVADIARRIFSERAAKAAFLLAALCPFLANYTAAVLTETLEVFFTALALDFALIGLNTLNAKKLRPWIGCGLAIAAAILLRPDGGLLLVALGLYLGFLMVKRWRERQPVAIVFWSGTLVAIFALAPLIPWTIRNMRTLHEFEPLTPRYASNPGDYVPLGFNRWVMTWMADYVSVQEIYWQEPGEKIDPEKLPRRAFDNEQQKERTLRVLDAYNEDTEIGPELDQQFNALAQERIRGHRFRYYVWLPLLRIADMWLRPRTELVPSDPRWWEFNDDLKGSAFAVGFGLINLFYVLSALAGALRRRPIPWIGLLLTFVIVRSLFLGTLENPETRYTLECYPVVIVLAAAFFAGGPNCTQVATLCTPAGRVAQRLPDPPPSICSRGFQTFRLCMLALSIVLAAELGVAISQKQVGFHGIGLNFGCFLQIGNSLFGIPL
jgi:Dolichyl-phosphate-mannose-protein mannosyltransferase